MTQGKGNHHGPDPLPPLPPIFTRVMPRNKGTLSNVRAAHGDNALVQALAGPEPSVRSFE